MTMETETQVPKNIIYGLIDPRDGCVRYIGKSTSGSRRIKQHNSNWHLTRENTRKANWIKSLISQGLKPEGIILEESNDPKKLSDLEKFWIANIKSVGGILYNATDGGDGTVGFKQPESLKLAMIGNKRAVGFKHTDEAKMKISISHKGRKKPPFTAEHHQKLSLARMGNKNALGSKRTKERPGNLGTSRLIPVKLLLLDKIILGVKHAAKELNMSPDWLIRNLKGKVKWKNGIVLAEYVKEKL
jgi:group I intron endonuclease